MLSVWKNNQTHDLGLQIFKYFSKIPLMKFGLLTLFNTCRNAPLLLIEILKINSRMNFLWSKSVANIGVWGYLDFFSSSSVFFFYFIFKRFCRYRKLERHFHSRNHSLFRAFNIRATRHNIKNRVPRLLDVFLCDWSWKMKCMWWHHNHNQ